MSPNIKNVGVLGSASKASCQGPISSVGKKHSSKPSLSGPSTNSTNINIWFQIEVVWNQWNPPFSLFSFPFFPYFPWGCIESSALLSQVGTNDGINLAVASHLSAQGHPKARATLTSTVHLHQKQTNIPKRAILMFSHQHQETFCKMHQEI